MYNPRFIADISFMYTLVLLCHLYSFTAKGRIGLTLNWRERPEDATVFRSTMLLQNGIQVEVQEKVYIWFLQFPIQ